MHVHSDSCAGRFAGHVARGPETATLAVRVVIPPSLATAPKCRFVTEMTSSDEKSRRDRSTPWPRAFPPGVGCVFLLWWAVESGPLAANSSPNKLRTGAVLLAIAYLGGGSALLGSLDRKLLWVWWFGFFPVVFAHHYLAELGFALHASSTGLCFAAGYFLMMADFGAHEKECRDWSRRLPDTRVVRTVCLLRYVLLPAHFLLLSWLAVSTRPPGWSVLAGMYALAAAIAFLSMLGGQESNDLDIDGCNAGTSRRDVESESTFP